MVSTWCCSGPGGEVDDGFGIVGVTAKGDFLPSRYRPHQCPESLHWSRKRLPLCPRSPSPSVSTSTSIVLKSTSPMSRCCPCSARPQDRCQRLSVEQTGSQVLSTSESKAPSLGCRAVAFLPGSLPIKYSAAAIINPPVLPIPLPPSLMSGLIT